MEVCGSHGGGGCLGDGTMMGLVGCKGGVGWLQWWCLGAAMVFGDWVEVRCGGHGVLGERKLGRRKVRREY